MLPQMMPLPWLLVFFMVFICFFSVTFIMSGNHLSFFVTLEKKVSKSFLSIPW